MAILPTVKSFSAVVEQIQKWYIHVGHV